MERSKGKGTRFEILGALFELQIHYSRPFSGFSFFYNAVVRARRRGFCTVSLLNADYGRGALDVRPS